MKKKIMILVSPNAFKESLTAIQAAKAISRGILSVWRETKIIKLPVADGGDGTLDVLVTGQGGKTKKIKVTDPLGNSVNARLGLLDKGKLAVIEMAEASGLRLVLPTQRNPLVATTYGTGELIQAALDLGVKEIIVGVGGSATVDGGVGMAMALGGKFLDKKGKSIGLGGNELNRLHHINLSFIDSRLRKTKIRVACDVQNPLLGSKGTVNVYAKQKGATPLMLPILESGMKNFSKVIQKDLKISVATVPGSGAAGGLGAGLIAFCDAQIESGADLVLDILHFDTYLRQVDLVITGEGKLDEQTIHGKAPFSVARRSKKYGIPVIAVAGILGENVSILHQYGITYMQSIQNRPIPPGFYEEC